MTLNGILAITLRYFTEFRKPAFQHITASARIELIDIVVGLCVRCRRKESSRSLSHLLMSFLLFSSPLIVYFVGELLVLN